MSLNPFKNMLNNYREGKPLLDGAPVFRGTASPDQTHTTFSEHKIAYGALLPSIAAQYADTRGTGEPGFIGVYSLDKTTGEFYKDNGIQQAIAYGNPDEPTYSKAEVEQLLTPLVAKLDQAQDSKEVARATRDIEACIRKECYEIPVKISDEAGKPVRPDELHALDTCKMRFLGGVRDTEAVVKSMSPVDMQSEQFKDRVAEGAKSTYFKEATQGMFEKLEGNNALQFKELEQQAHLSKEAVLENLVDKATSLEQALQFSAMARPTQEEKSVVEQAIALIERSRDSDHNPFFEREAKQENAREDRGQERQMEMASAS